MNRRDVLRWLAALPVVGWLFHPVTAEGPMGKPKEFEMNWRYLTSEQWRKIWLVLNPHLDFGDPRPCFAIPTPDFMFVVHYRNGKFRAGYSEVEGQESVIATDYSIGQPVMMTQPRPRLAVKRDDSALKPGHIWADLGDGYWPILAKINGIKIQDGARIELQWDSGSVPVVIAAEIL